MATSTFKTFLDSDKTTTRTLLHEYIPMTGTLVSGTYGGDTVWLGNEPHVKTFAHGMFDSIYDYPYLSSSANHLLDVSIGYHFSSALSQSTPTTQQAKKLNMYAQMSQILAGYDLNGDITPFDEDGDFGVPGATGDPKNTSCVFLSLSRLITKDEIKKGSFSMKVGVGAAVNNVDEFVVQITDSGAETGYKSNSPAGEYGILNATQILPAGSARLSATSKVGLVYYQAGVVVLTSSLFMGKATISTNEAEAATGATGVNANLNHKHKGLLTGLHCTGTFSHNNTAAVFSNLITIMTGSEVHRANNFIRERLFDITFNNTTELNSTVHFCRASHNEFNYSANRTYLNESRIRVKKLAQDMPRSYITSVGLYSANNELMAVAKLSEPIRKDPTNEVTLRVRLDY